ncbi:hypothetical protein BYZ73_19150 [Rhodovulum viride]|uniref:Methyltransferase family protein n=1 Tax=Rhodovulum viride TaxID=1231134 RepID=A0ABX9DDN7_9RHOB|nr:hypothetical protein [Rhodovulum viride]RAP39710.1 hypothetical protein BYZ73_19150 [Rhodovulum viride]
MAPADPPSALPNCPAEIPDRTRALFDSAPWTGPDIRETATALEVPTMLSRAEQAFYLWLARDWAQDAGAIVDLGCFAGGSTARLAEGRRQAGHLGSILAYDRFTATPEVKAKVLYAAGIAPFEGADLLPLVRQLLARWPVTLVPGEIRSAVWPGGPIEILTIDAAKATDTADAIAGTFFPALLPGSAVVVQQDYFHWRQPWIAAQMEALAGCFAPLTAGPGTTAAFLCLRPPTPADLARAACHGASDVELAGRLTAARARFARFGCEERFDRLDRALAANPGQRIAWRMRRPD